MYKGTFSSWFSKSGRFKVLEHFEEMFPRYYMHSDLLVVVLDVQLHTIACHQYQMSFYGRITNNWEKKIQHQFVLFAQQFHARVQPEIASIQSTVMYMFLYDFLSILKRVLQDYMKNLEEMSLCFSHPKATVKFHNNSPYLFKRQSSLFNQQWRLFNRRALHNNVTAIVTYVVMATWLFHERKLLNRINKKCYVRLCVAINSLHFRREVLMP